MRLGPSDAAPFAGMTQTVLARPVGFQGLSLSALSKHPLLNVKGFCGVGLRAAHRGAFVPVPIATAITGFTVVETENKKPRHATACARADFSSTTATTAPLQGHSRNVTYAPTRRRAST